MARSIEQIFAELVNEKNSNTALSGLTSTSSVSIWQNILFVVALCIWSLENIFELFIKDVDALIQQKKPHSERWYAEKAKQFRYGYNLLADSDTYSDLGVTETQIKNSKIVAQAAVVDNNKGIRIKVAKIINNELGPLSNIELLALVDYFNKVKDAGVKCNITSAVADSLKLRLQIKYNALVLNDSGQQLDGTNNQPIQDAINAYLKNLPFNGVLELDKLIDAIQSVYGVEHAYVLEATAAYGTLAHTSFTNNKYIPDAGYMRIYNTSDLVLNMLANG
jgi:hypothetical protein